MFYSSYLHPIILKHSRNFRRNIKQIAGKLSGTRNVPGEAAPRFALKPMTQLAVARLKTAFHTYIQQMYVLVTERQRGLRNDKNALGVVDCKNVSSSF